MTSDFVSSERSAGDGTPKNIPIPPCKNTNRKTAKCRRMCCARATDRIVEETASGIQTRIDKKGTVQQQLAGWWQTQ